MLIMCSSYFELLPTTRTYSFRVVVLSHEHLPLQNIELYEKNHLYRKFIHILHSFVAARFIIFVLAGEALCPPNLYLTDLYK
jgi:hypothetical protein